MSLPNGAAIAQIVRVTDPVAYAASVSAILLACLSAAWLPDLHYYLPQEDFPMAYTRREFTRIAMAALPSPSAVNLFAAPQPNSVFGGVRIGVITDSFRALPGSAEETLKYCVVCGFRVRRADRGEEVPGVLQTRACLAGCQPTA